MGGGRARTPRDASSVVSERGLGLLPAQMRQVGEFGPPLAARDEALADAGIDLLFEEVTLLGCQNASHAILHWLDLSRSGSREALRREPLVGTGQAPCRQAVDGARLVTTVELRCVPSLDPNESTAGDLDRRLLERHELGPDPDDSAREDVGTQPGAMYERAQEARP